MYYRPFQSGTLLWLSLLYNFGVISKPSSPMLGFVRVAEGPPVC